MASVTKRVAQIQQPRGGYLNPKVFKIHAFIDDKDLNPNESIGPSLVGLAVDYLTRFMRTKNVVNAFGISILGAKIIGKIDQCIKLISRIKGLDDDSIIAASKTVGYDVCYRASVMAYRPVEEINPDQNTIENIRIMVERSLSFFQKFGPVTVDGFTFDGGYTKTIDTGDGDFLTADTLWDFKVSSKEPTNKHTLQVLVYYIMGLHSMHPYFKNIKRLGFFNPRLNIAYTFDVANIPASTIQDIEKNVICY